MAHTLLHLLLGPPRTPFPQTEHTHVHAVFVTHPPPLCFPCDNPLLTVPTTLCAVPQMVGWGRREPCLYRLDILWGCQNPDQ